MNIEIIHKGFNGMVIAKRGNVQFCCRETDIRKMEIEYYLRGIGYIEDDINRLMPIYLEFDNHLCGKEVHDYATN
jgi:hypothetical protein